MLLQHIGVSFLATGGGEQLDGQDLVFLISSKLPIDGGAGAYWASLK